MASDGRAIRVGLVGCGFIGRFHSRNIRDVARSERVPVEYAAVCDVEVERAETFAGLTGAEVVREPAELIGRDDIDVVYVCAETAEHPVLVAEAARQGKHVFCEKPLARTLGEVEGMVAAVEAAGVRHQVGLVLRFAPIFRVLENLMDNQSLGPFLAAHMIDEQQLPVDDHHMSAWRGSYERAGGGTLIEHSIHDIDLFARLFGPIERVRCHRRETSGHAGVEDVAQVTFEHTPGHQTSLTSVWHAIRGRPSRRRLEVLFAGGWFATEEDWIGPIEYQLAGEATVTMTADDVVDRYCELEGLDEWEREAAARGSTCDYAFLRAVWEGRPAAPGFDVGLAAHRVVDAAYRSDGEGQAFGVESRP